MSLLSAEDLNDFISPGVACIKPVEIDYKEGEVEIQIDSDGKPLEISKIDGKQTNLSPAQISLADCLACSGCITSAEEVLVAQHSHHELLKALELDKTFVVSISQQARASLSTAFNMSVENMDKLLINLFKQMGFKYIIGTNLGRKISLINEAKQNIGKKGPILSSICPGWVLYAEKTHPYILPKISTVKSAQQITGCLLKNLTAFEGISKENIFHLTIMPCFDKKLESARPEIYGDTLPDVDCVLTPKELITLVEETNYKLIPKIGLSNILNQDINQVYKENAPKNWPFVDYSWYNDSGSASGGYAFNYIRMVQDDLILQGYTKTDFKLEKIEGRNSDLYEYRLYYQEMKIASSAVVNGFKNIQNLVRKLNPNTKINPIRRRGTTKDQADASKVDYVEIMACPQGCINGGGQISHPQDISEKDWLEEALNKYNSIPMFDLTINTNQIEMFMKWCNSFEQQFNITNERLLKTYFNAIEKPSDPQAILVGSKW
ncbi:unnamed protein product [Candida verbasci]|uniref:Cytosolic Fe-S cluster assembly factor NAR1 n=1 Tax=Candida verbasci TaxID=1227364 RepID=A0A9W4TT37_9ASCO|nr:unnamed protein product [Candida verbasci]